MNPTESLAEDLIARREQLILRSAQLRDRLSARSGSLRPTLNAVDRLRDRIDAVRKNQAFMLLLGSAVVGAALVRPRATINLGMRAWSGWQMFRRMQPMARGVLRSLV